MSALGLSMVACVAMLAATFATPANAMYTYLNINEERCYSEEVVRNSEDMAIRVDIFYNIERAQTQGITFTLHIHQVSDNGRRNAGGTQTFSLALNEPEVVSFTAHYTSHYHLCFVSSGPVGGPAAKLELDIMGSRGSASGGETALEARGRQRHAARPMKKALYDAKVQEVERLMDTLKANAALSASQQVEFDNTVASTHFRVVAFTICNVVIMIVAGLWQLLHLKQFFKAKKVV